MGFSTFVRRGTEYASNHIANGDQKFNVKAASPWLIALFAVTLVAVSVAFWAVCSYSQVFKVSSLHSSH